MGACFLCADRRCATQPAPDHASYDSALPQNIYLYDLKHNFITAQVGTPDAKASTTRRAFRLLPITTREVLHECHRPSQSRP